MFLPEIYAARRKQLTETLTANGHTGIVLLPAAPDLARTFADNTFAHRQESSFLYYFGHPLSACAGTIDLDSGDHSFWKNTAGINEILWTGEQTPVESLAQQIACNHCGSLSALDALLHDAVSTGRTIHYLPPLHAETTLWLSCRIGIAVQEISHRVSLALVDAVIAQRNRKSQEEVEQIEAALNLSAAMYARAMPLARSGGSETDVVRAMHTVLAENGAVPSFTPICSIRSEVLHNHSYTNALNKGQLLLIDSGAESPLFYASDITRTIPVDGQFTGRQREVYDIVLEAQSAAIDAALPDTPFVDCHMKAVRIIAEGLRAMGLLRGSVDDIVSSGAHALFMPHGLGHMLGLDAHDMENLGEDRVGYGEGFTRSNQFGLKGLRLARPLREGFVITVEPGIYFIPALIDRWKAAGKFDQFINYAALEAFRDFGGIRIEDDLLITADGNRVLGTPIPKSPEDIFDAVNG